MRDNITLNNAKIAQRLSYHHYYLNEVFLKSEGVSFHKYIMRERAAKAKELIGTKDKSFEYIEKACGFSSALHLSRAIKAEYGITPSVMRKL